MHGSFLEPAVPLQAADLQSLYILGGRMGVRHQIPYFARLAA